MLTFLAIACTSRPKPAETGGDDTAPEADSNATGDSPNDSRGDSSGDSDSVSGTDSDSASSARPNPVGWTSVGGGPSSPFAAALEGDAATLAVAWTGGDPANATLEFAPTIADDVAYVGGDAGITALSLAEGTVLATLSVGHRIEGPPAIGANGLVAGGLYLDETGQPGALHVARWDGALTEAWSVEGAFPYFGRAVTDGDTAWTADNSGAVNAWDLAADTATAWWSAMAADSAYSSLAVDDARVYVGTRYGGLYALDRETGAQEWVFTLPEGTTSYASPTIDGDAVWYGRNCGLEREIGTCGAVWRIDTATGAGLCELLVDGGDVRSPVAIGTDGGYFAEAETGTLYAVDRDCAVRWTVANPDVLPSGDSAPVVVTDALGERILALQTRSDALTLVVVDAATGATLAEVSTGQHYTADASGKNLPSLSVSGPWVLTNVAGSTVAFRTE